MLQLTPEFEAKGFVEHHGAPNFWFKDAERDVRIWWYKYPGRGMESNIDFSHDELRRLRTAFDAWVDANWRVVLEAAVEEAVSHTFRQMFGENMGNLLSQGAAMALSKAPDPREAIAAFRDSIGHIRVAAHHIEQAQLTSEALDEIGAPRGERDGMPEEYRFDYALSVRLKWLLKHVDTDAAVQGMKDSLNEAAA